MADSAANKPTASTVHEQAVTESVPAPPTVGGDDSDPDFDDLDDVLDQFSANAPTKTTTKATEPDASRAPASSGPGRPEKDVLNLSDQPLPDGPKPGESEEEFINRLSSEMSKLFANIPSDADIAAQNPDMTKMGKELEEFTRQMEEQGVKPEDLLKAILGEEGAKVANVATAERERRDSEKEQSRSRPSSSTAPQASKANKSFEDTIRQTMSRLDESDTQAKTATQQSASKSDEDLLAEMLKALDGGGGEGGEEGISKMFLDMMQQLTQKDMLYEPMKELHDQYPDWLQKHKPPTIKQDDYDRYVKQSQVVRDITNKFEEPGFKDEDEKCRQYVWDKMQEMQALGAPPEELVKNPFPGTDFGAIPGLGGGGDGLKDEGCPTQ
ncbi:Peroxisome chaperone and import receptor [Lithohypha guttulata]|uniref:Peroxisome chaperone and import receptor n=1 Tax=Lithohypha guttulata TaxID=1690604 RepID=A0AAN7T639_9EURO|nr:Peroxisome chaperone and import receptor [Lithohypha guttulata]KAK5091164.1 Peroxisome chaperone and import receptor [Lithohypha guttulata]